MPAALNFSTLQQDMRNYLERGGSLDETVENQIPRLINLAERRIARDLKIQGFILPLLTIFKANASTLAKPSGWRQTISMFYGSDQSRTPIFPRSLEYCREYWPDPTQTDVPMFYADYDYLHWLIAPTPTVNLNGEIIIYCLPPLLDATNTNNWVTDFAPEVLQYRAFTEMSIFLRADADVQRFKGEYQDALSSINTEDLQKIVDRTTTRQEA